MSSHASCFAGRISVVIFSVLLVSTLAIVNPWPWNVSFTDLLEDALPGITMRSAASKGRFTPQFTHPWGFGNVVFVNVGMDCEA